MAPRNCRKCAGEIPPGAATCSRCGTPAGLSKGARAALFVGGGCAIAILVPLALVVVFALFSSTSGDTVKRASAGPATPVARELVLHKTGETFQVGYTTYCVLNSWWSARLSNNPYLNRRPDAAFLIVKLTVRNDDTKARSVPPLQLIDEVGAEYGAFAGASMIEGTIDLFTELNPGVTKSGHVVFDAPEAHTYKLKVSGGYWSSDDAMIDLEPNPKR